MTKKMTRSEALSSAAQRIAKRIDASGGDTACHPWTGRIEDNGYAKIGVGGRTQWVHRIVREIACGSIPNGMVAQEFGVCVATVHAVIHHKRWSRTATVVTARMESQP